MFHRFFEGVVKVEIRHYVCGWGWKTKDVLYGCPAFVGRACLLASWLHDSPIEHCSLELDGVTVKRFPSVQFIFVKQMLEARIRFYSCLLKGRYRQCGVSRDKNLWGQVIKVFLTIASIRRSLLLLWLPGVIIWRNFYLLHLKQGLHQPVGVHKGFYSNVVTIKSTSEPRRGCLHLLTLRLVFQGSVYIFGREKDLLTSSTDPCWDKEHW